MLASAAMSSAGWVLGDASKKMDGSSVTIRDVDAGRTDLIPKAGRGPPGTRQIDHGAEPPKRSRKVRARITEIPRYDPKAKRCRSPDTT